MQLSGIYGITSRDHGKTHEESARIFLDGGIKIVQYREKTADTKMMIEEATRIRDLCKSYNAAFIVDDRIDVAMAVDPDGVHLGQEDAPISLARRLLPGKIIGISAKTPEQARSAEDGGAAYLGVGAVYPTSTKVKTLLIGLAGFNAVKTSCNLPLFAIGGIKPSNIGEIKRAGAAGAAILSGILASPDPVKVAAEYVKAWETQ